jgi:hypothetical protein
MIQTMATTDCATCGTRLSTNDAYCPGCGFPRVAAKPPARVPTGPRRSKDRLVAGAVVVLLVVLAGGAVAFARRDTTSPEERAAKVVTGYLQAYHGWRCKEAARLTTDPKTTLHKCIADAPILARFEITWDPLKVTKVTIKGNQGEVRLTYAVRAGSSASTHKTEIRRVTKVDGRWLVREQ